jgi:hypothetical protein
MAREEVGQLEVVNCETRDLLEEKLAQLEILTLRCPLTVHSSPQTHITM